MNDIQHRLGYRIRLIEGTFDDRVSDGTLNSTLRLVNEGWGKIFNPRGLELVLRKTTNSEEVVFPLSQDPRFWGPGDSVTLNIKVSIPRAVPLAKYHLFLNLPDTVSGLYGRPEYSIRLANKGVWEASTGYNSLLHDLVINSHSSNITGSISTTKRNGVLLDYPNRFDRSMYIPFKLFTTTQVDIDVYSLQGRLVKRLFTGVLHAGTHDVNWSTHDITQRKVPNGIYLLRFKTKDNEQINRIILQR